MTLCKLPNDKVNYFNYKESHSLFFNFSHFVKVTFLATAENWIIFQVIFDILKLDYRSLASNFTCVLGTFEGFLPSISALRWWTWYMTFVILYFYVLPWLSFWYIWFGSIPSLVSRFSNNISSPFRCRYRCLFGQVLPHWGLLTPQRVSGECCCWGMGRPQHRAPLLCVILMPPGSLVPLGSSTMRLSLKAILIDPKGSFILLYL